MTISVGTSGSEFIVSNTTAFTTPPQSTLLTNGNLLISWKTSGGAILGHLYDSSGNSLGAPFQLEPAVTNGALFPTVTALSGGGFVVHYDALVDDSSTIYGEDQVDYAQVFDASGQPIGNQPVQELNLGSGPDIGNQNQAVTAIPNNLSAVAYDAQQADPENGYIGHIKLQLYSGTTPVGNLIDVSDPATTGSYHNVFNPAIATTTTGIVVVWTQQLGQGANPQVFSRLFNFDGTSAGPISARIAVSVRVG